MERVAVLIPGIMGSRLWYDDGTGGAVELWSENLRKDYIDIARGRSSLIWTGKKANAEVLKQFKWGIFPLISLWGATEAFLLAHSEFKQLDCQLWFGYDWRQSLLDTAVDLAEALTARAGVSVSEPPPLGNDVRFAIIAHSMGGVLARVAVGKKVLHPEWLDRLFTIGSPLQGAPKALETLYGDTSPIDLIATWIRILHLFNGQQFLDALRESLQSFPSAYQLLPHANSNYIYGGINASTNALTENHIPDDRRNEADEAHKASIQGGEILGRAGTKCFSIFTSSHLSKRTEMLYRVSPASPGYVIEWVMDRNEFGDGTVPRHSATDGCADGITRLPVTAVTHHKMCNAKSVVNHLRINLN